MPTPIGPYSLAYRAGDFLYCSGQIGAGPDGALVNGVVAQAQQALSNLADVLEQHSASLSQVVRTTVYLTDMSSYADVNEVYAKAFGDHKPARAAMAVAALPRGAECEIDAIAFLG